jgi:arylsulfatase A-like enzyme
MHRTAVQSLIVVFLCLAATAGQAAERKKNVLFILTDDQRWDTIHALGNPEVQTPVADELVGRGFTFTNVYCQGSMIGGVCLPSRTMIMTGRSLWRIPHQLRALEAPPGVPLLPSLVNEQGYVSFHTGKPGNACRYANAQFHTNIESGKNRESAVEHCENVIRFLEQYDGAKPFFACLAPCVPHDPRWSSPEVRALYDDNRITLSKNFMPQHPFDNGELYIRDELLAPHPRTPEEMRRHLADYYASVTHLDQQIGRVLDVLRARYLMDDTIIIFTSDQGLAVGGRHGLMGKQNLYEHVKPPLVIAGPGIPHGKSDALVYLFDLFPTICELTGAPVPEVAEGQSLLPIVRGEKTRLRDSILCAYRESQRMVRDERWKLIAYNAAGEKNYQLFDLANDPDELNNLADDPKYAAERTRLEKLLADSRRAFDDPIDFDVLRHEPSVRQEPKPKAKAKAAY